MKHSFVHDSATLNISNHQECVMVAEIEKYIRWKSTYAPQAAKCYSRWLKKFNECVKKDAENLRFEDLQKFIETTQHYSCGTRGFIVTVLRDYCRWLRLTGYNDISFELLKKPRGKVNHHKPLQQEEFEKILFQVNPDSLVYYRDMLILLLLWDTGMRVGEAAALEIEQLDLKDRSAVIHTGKTFKLRKVIWSETTNEFLLKYLEQRKKQGGSYLFSSIGSGSILKASIRTLQVAIQSNAQRAGIKMTAHDLRTSWATNRYRKGLDLQAISWGLGHASIKTTQIYVQPEDFEQESKLRIFV